jgi:hypothetical protein
VEYSQSISSEGSVDTAEYDEFMASEEVKMLRKDFQIIEEFLEQLRAKDMEEEGWKKFVDKGT